MVPEDSGYATRSSDFTTLFERISPLCPGPLAGRVAKNHAVGEVIVVRYADDFVPGFREESDARNCLAALKDRLTKFGLELHPEKTRLIEFGRYAASHRSQRGERPPETFDFPGFTHISGKTRKGMFTIRRISALKNMKAKLQELQEL
jgi:RNA-directed DNA polymerase